MPRPRKLKPAYCRDRSSGRAFVTLNGKRKYLGEHGSQASRDEYDRVIGEWIAAGRQTPPSENPVRGVTVSTVVAAFWTQAQSHYAHCIRADGKATGELDNYRLALRPLRRLYGATPAADFNAVALENVRTEMVKLGWCRTYINRQILRLKRVFRWAVGRELVPPGMGEKLAAVDGLRAGRTDAREREPVKPVDEGHAAAIFAFLSPQLQAMIELQSLTGMRPGELCVMRGTDIDTTGRTWKYCPAAHKTAHHGHKRVVDLGPKARAILRQFLKTDTRAYIFSPAEAADARRQVRRENRTTPLTCGNFPGSNGRHRARRSPGDRYDVHSYRRAIARACQQAFPPPAHLARLRIPANGRKKKATRWETSREWKVRLGPENWAELTAWQRKHHFHPHQLRHTAATRWRKEHGSEMALVLLGDKTTRMIDVYAEKDRAGAEKIMEKTG